MAKLSVSIPDDLANELRDEARENVSRFVTAAVRDALDRRRLLRALAALDDEFGPLDPEDLAEADEEFRRVEAAVLTEPSKRSAAHAWTRRTSSAATRTRASKARASGTRAKSSRS